MNLVCALMATGIIVISSMGMTKELSHEKFYKVRDTQAPVFKNIEMATKCIHKEKTCDDKNLPYLSPATFIVVSAPKGDLVEVIYFEIDESTSQCIDDVHVGDTASESESDESLEDISDDIPQTGGDPSPAKQIKARLAQALKTNEPINNVLEEIDAKLNAEPETDVMEDILKSHCLTHGKGWVEYSKIERTRKPDFSGKTDGKSKQTKAEGKRTKKKTKLTSKEIARIQKCDGEVDFGGIQGSFFTTGKDKNRECKFSLKEGCGDPSQTLFEKLRSADRMIMGTGASKRTLNVCKSTVNASVRQRCGQQSAFIGDEDEDKDKKSYLARFSTLREHVREKLSHDNTLSKIKGVKNSEGLLMCLFAEESPDLDPGKLNYSYCNNMNSATAVGLGQITRDTLIELALKYSEKDPERYPVKKNFNELKQDITSQIKRNRAREIIDPLYLRLADDEDLQIQATIDALVLKSATGKSNIDRTLKLYFPQPASSGPKKWQQVKQCMNKCFKKRHGYKKLNQSEQALEDLLAAQCLVSKIPSDIDLRGIDPKQWAWDWIEYKTQKPRSKEGGK